MIHRKSRLDFYVTPDPITVEGCTQRVGKIMRRWELCEVYFPIDFSEFKMAMAAMWLIRCKTDDSSSHLSSRDDSKRKPTVEKINQSYKEILEALVTVCETCRNAVDRYEGELPLLPYSYFARNSDHFFQQWTSSPLHCNSHVQDTTLVLMSLNCFCARLPEYSDILNDGVRSELYGKVISIMELVKILDGQLAEFQAIEDAIDDRLAVELRSATQKPRRPVVGRPRTVLEEPKVLVNPVLGRLKEVSFAIEREIKYVQEEMHNSVRGSRQYNAYENCLFELEGLVDHVIKYNLYHQMTDGLSKVPVHPKIRSARRKRLRIQA